MSGAEEEAGVEEAGGSSYEVKEAMRFAMVGVGVGVDAVDDCRWAEAEEEGVGNVFRCDEVEGEKSAD